MQIKTEFFTLNAEPSRHPDFYSVTFTDINYTRNKGNIINIKGIRFESYSYPEYNFNYPNSVKMPGSSHAKDTLPILLPVRLVQHVADIVNKVHDNYYRHDLTLHEGIYSFIQETGENVTTKCKEQACLYIVGRDLIDFSFGRKLDSAQLELLNSYIDKLPEEAKIHFELQQGILTCSKIPDWWKSFYRAGWLLLAIRIITGYYAGLSPSTKTRFQAFIDGCYTLSDENKKYWSSTNNWISNDVYEKAFPKIQKNKDISVPCAVE